MLKLSVMHDMLVFILEQTVEEIKYNFFVAVVFLIHLHAFFNYHLLTDSSAKYVGFHRIFSHLIFPMRKMSVVTNSNVFTSSTTTNYTDVYYHTQPLN